MILLLSVVIFFGQCRNQNEISMKYNLTVCDDAWNIENTMTSLEKAEIINQYLDDEHGIETVSIEVDKISGAQPDCFGCICTSGDIVEIRVDNTFENTLNSLGFYKE